MLIEGNAGFGKTTLLLRLAVDWADGKAYMDQFAFVFLIKLRQFQVTLYFMTAFCMHCQ